MQLAQQQQKTVQQLSQIQQLQSAYPPTFSSGMPGSRPAMQPQSHLMPPPPAMASMFPDNGGGTPPPPPPYGFVPPFYVVPPPIFGSMGSSYQPGAQ